MKRLFQSNLLLRLMSVALAVAVWFVIAGRKTAERGLTVPVELRNFPRDLELTGDPANSVDVRLRASPGIIHALGPGQVSAEIDLAGASEGERIVHLTPESIRVPFGVSVVKITPTILTLNLERTLEKVVPVRPRLIGRPAEGFEVAEVESSPPEVRIAGPKSRVQEVESAFTEPVSVADARESVVDTVTVGLEDPLLRLRESSRVRVTARVRERQEKRAFSPIPVSVRGGAGRPRPAAVRVVVAGPPAVLGRLAASRLRAYVVLGGGGSAAARLPVAVEFDQEFSGLSAVEIEPATVAVRPDRQRSTP